MEISKILTADVLDIIFEGRNKSYGAYELRKSYSRRLLISLSVMFSVLLLLLAGYVLANRGPKEQIAKEIIIPDSELKLLEQEQPKEEIPPPVQKTEPPKMETKQFTTFKIEPDDKVKPEEAPPPNETLEDTKIGTVNQEGLKDDGIVAPPSDEGNNRGITAIERKEEPNDKIWEKVEIESQYPGGMQAWTRFLTKNLPPNIPQEAIDNGIGGRIEIKFVVDTLGNVSDIEPISGPKELYEMAIKVIRKSGKWEPAIQNGRRVKSYKRQPIIVQIQDQ